jgi:hypothetical protein
MIIGQIRFQNQRYDFCTAGLPEVSHSNKYDQLPTGITSGEAAVVVIIR